MKIQDNINYDSFDIGALCEYISENHHVLERKLLGEIRDHMEVVLKVEKNRLGEAPFVRDNFLQLAWKVEQHIDAEEQIIFPFAEKYGAKGMIRELMYFDDLQHITDFLQKLCKKHESILESIEAIRNLTHHYNADVKDSPTHKICYNELQQLDLCIQQHFFIVNNVLLKRLEQLESTLHSEELKLKKEINK